jgi:beta-phosphoglucomutase
MVAAAVVFDMDGLMLDTEPLYKLAWQGASAELGYPLEDRFYARFVGRSTTDCESLLMTQFGSGFPLDDFRGRWPQWWRAEVVARGIQPKPGLQELLTFLQERRLPMAVATSSETDYATFSLRHAGLEGRFEIVVTGEQVSCGKPAPDIYLEAARRLQVNPADCIALEDSEAGTLAATRAGMRALLIPDGSPPSDAAVRAAFRVLASLRDARVVIADLIDAQREGHEL